MGDGKVTIELSIKLFMIPNPEISQLNWVKLKKRSCNRPYLCPLYWTWKYLQLRIMRGVFSNANDTPRQERLFSPIPRIWTLPILFSRTLLTCKLYFFCNHVLGFLNVFTDFILQYLFRKQKEKLQRPLENMFKSKIPGTMLTQILKQNMSELTSIITSKEIMITSINMRRLLLISTCSSTSIKITLKGVYLLTNNVLKGLQFHQLFTQASSFLSKLIQMAISSSIHRKRSHGLCSLTL